MLNHKLNPNSVLHCMRYRAQKLKHLMIIIWPGTSTEFILPNSVAQIECAKRSRIESVVLTEGKTREDKEGVWSRDSVSASEILILEY